YTNPRCLFRSSSRAANFSARSGRRPFGRFFQVGGMTVATSKYTSPVLEAYNAKRLFGVISGTPLVVRSHVKCCQFELGWNSSDIVRFLSRGTLCCMLSLSVLASTHAIL